MKKIISTYLILVLLASESVTFAAGNVNLKDGVLPLNLQQATRIALENNFDIQLYRIDKRISQQDILKARHIYDTEFSASYIYDENRLKPASTISGDKTTEISKAIDLEKQLPAGTVLSLGLASKKQGSNSPFATTNPYHDSQISASVKQPFGKNKFGIVDKNTIKISDIDVENTGFTSADKIEKELADVQKAYWTVVLNTKKHQMQSDMLELARKLYESNLKNFDIGLVEEPELFATEANLKERQMELRLSQDALDSAQDTLKLKLNLPKDVVIMPTDGLFAENMEAEFEQKLSVALKNRRDYKKAKNEVRSRKLSVELKKNSMWPEVDLTGTFRKNGLNRQFARSIREWHLEDNPEYTVLIEFKYPLENRKAKAEFNQKKLEQAKVLVELKKVECKILTEVHNSVNHANATKDAAFLQREAANLQKLKYEGELKRFTMGRSSTDTLIRYQDDYLNAKLIMLDSFYNYLDALVDLRLQTSELLAEFES